jgi:hypothetical protein
MPIQPRCRRYFQTLTPYGHGGVYVQIQSIPPSADRSARQTARYKELVTQLVAAEVPQGLKVRGGG